MAAALLREPSSRLLTHSDVDQLQQTVGEAFGAGDEHAAGEKRRMPGVDRQVAHLCSACSLPAELSGVRPWWALLSCCGSVHLQQSAPDLPGNTKGVQEEVQCHEQSAV